MGSVINSKNKNIEELANELESKSNSIKEMGSVINSKKNKNIEELANELESKSNSN